MLTTCVNTINIQYCRTPIDSENSLIVFTNTVAIFKAFPQVCIEFLARSVEISGVVHLVFGCSRVSKLAVYFSYGKKEVAIGRRMM
jgi:hypothetical protein